MKYLIFITLLLSSVIARGQDLIVATSGDSLKCKIVEVKSDEVQFRFGTGGIISIPRNEVASYQYNFAPAAPTQRDAPAANVEPVYVAPANVPPREKEPASSSSVKYPPFYISVVLGGGSFGEYSIDEYNFNPKGTPIIFGMDFAYFFIKSLGVGFKLNATGGDVTYTYTFLGITNDVMTCYDMVMFYGPALYGRWGKDKVAFTASLGIGGLNWSQTNAVIDGLSYEDESYSSFGGFISAGVDYMFSRHFGVGFNMQSLLGKIKYTDYDEDLHAVRNPTGLGFNVGFYFRF